MHRSIPLQLGPEDAGRWHIVSAVATLIDRASNSNSHASLSGTAILCGGSVLYRHERPSLLMPTAYTEFTVSHYPGKAPSSCLRLQPRSLPVVTDKIYNLCGLFGVFRRLPSDISPASALSTSKHESGEARESDCKGHHQKTREYKNARHGPSRMKQSACSVDKRQRQPLGDL